MPVGFCLMVSKTTKKLFSKNAGHPVALCACPIVLRKIILAVVDII